MEVVRQGRLGSQGKAVTRAVSLGNITMNKLVWAYIRDLVTAPGPSRVCPGEPELREMWAFASKLPKVSVRRKVVAEIV